jgi:hypothetical protein
MLINAQASFDAHPNHSELVSQTETLTHALYCCRMPLLASFGSDAAPVQHVGSSTCCEVCSLDDDRPHGFSTRSSGWALATPRRFFLLPRFVTSVFV